MRIEQLDKALAEIEQVNWLPAWGQNRIAGTVAARPDWCISRQLWWGHRIPVFYDLEALEKAIATDATRTIASQDSPT